MIETVIDFPPQALLDSTAGQPEDVMEATLRVVGPADGLDDSSGPAPEENSLSTSDRAASPTPIPQQVPVPPPLTMPSSIFRMRAKWECFVDAVAEEGFSAAAHDLAGQVEPLSVEFSFDEVSDDDRHLVEPGAVFYWTIGQAETETHRIQGVSHIYFRRLPRTPRPAVSRPDDDAALARRLGWTFPDTER